MPRGVLAEKVKLGLGLGIKVRLQFTGHFITDFSVYLEIPLYLILEIPIS